MGVVVCRSQRVEDLVDVLARELEVSWPDDPFEAVPILVGSRGMERWLRHELATRLGGVARLAFVFPRTMFEGAARWLLGRPGAGDRSAFWERAPRERDAWSGPALVARVVPAMRARLGDARFDRVRDYLGHVGERNGEEVRAREFAFAQDVSRTIERLLHDRPDDAIAWARDADAAGSEHAWIAVLLRDLEAIDDPSPARTLARISDLPPAPERRRVMVFGLSTLQPGDKRRIEALARHLDFHLFALVPSRTWLGDARNAILANDGVPSRDLQAWLERATYTEPIEPPPHPHAATLLGRVQEWIDRAADDPSPEQAPWAAHASCGSIEVHACHGPLRQCEALRDELLRRFAADATLEPRHVLVTTPDVATYAPLLAAVFARHGNGTPPIPLHIADLGIRSTNPVADALLRALALSEERVTASRLVEFLAVQPVRARLRLDENDVADLRAMVVDSGIRWAWDAADRAHHGQPSLDQNTVRFGLERLALGVLMHDPGDLGVVPAAPGVALAPAVPFDLESRERVERFGRLAEACEKLKAIRDAASAPCSSRQWRERLRVALDELTHVGDDAAWLRLQVDQRIDELLPGEDAEGGMILDRSAVVALLRGAFDLPQHGDRPVTGAVTVCGLEPMRSVPFRVIAMLGLDDGAFPRPSARAAWDPFATPRAGEYDRRAIDRHMLLEALLCARDALLLFGTGFEPLRGERAPLSVVVSELVEVVAAGVGSRTAKAIEHPLQPWSAHAFDDDRRLPFDPLRAEAARAHANPREAGLAATKPGAAWPPEEHAPSEVTAEMLASALARPQRELLARRLGLVLGDDDESVPDREPLEQDGLEAWDVRDRVLRELAEGREPRVEALEARLRGEGVLPLSAAGRVALAACIEEAREAIRHAQSIPGAPGERLQVSCRVDDVLVSAVAPGVRTDGAKRNLVWLTASRNPNPRQQLVAWVTLLVAAASGAAVDAAHVAACDNPMALRAPRDAHAARAHLAALVRLWRRSRSGALLLFPNLSREVAVQRAKNPSLADVDAVRAAAAKWESARAGAVADRTDAWVAPLFGHLAIEDLARNAATIVECADEVWGPLIASGAP